MLRGRFAKQQSNICTFCQYRLSQQRPPHPARPFSASPCSSSSDPPGPRRPSSTIPGAQSNDGWGVSSIARPAPSSPALSRRPDLNTTTPNSSDSWGAAPMPSVRPPPKQPPKVVELGDGSKRPAGSFFLPATARTGYALRPRPLTAREAETAAEAPRSEEAQYSVQKLRWIKDEEKLEHLDPAERRRILLNKMAASRNPSSYNRHNRPPVVGVANDSKYTPVDSNLLITRQNGAGYGADYGDSHSLYRDRMRAAQYRHPDAPPANYRTPQSLPSLGRSHQGVGSDFTVNFHHSPKSYQERLSEGKPSDQYLRRTGYNEPPDGRNEFPVKLFRKSAAKDMPKPPSKFQNRRAKLPPDSTSPPSLSNLAQDSDFWSNGGQFRDSTRNIAPTPLPDKVRPFGLPSHLSGLEASTAESSSSPEWGSTFANGPAASQRNPLQEWNQLARIPKPSDAPAEDSSRSREQWDKMMESLGAEEKPTITVPTGSEDAFLPLTGPQSSSSTPRASGEVQHEVRSKPPQAVAQAVNSRFDQPRYEKGDRIRNQRQEGFGRDKKPSKGGRGKRGRHDEDDWQKEDAYDDYLEKRQQREERKAQRQAERTSPIPIILPELIGVTALANALKIKPEDFLEQLGELGFEGVSLDSLMAGETAALVAQEYGYEPTVEAGESQDLKPLPAPEDTSALPSRPPVVTIMGHVDHGKTTLLDYLRQSSVAAQEHGGITQHIGAFSVKLSSGKPITFLDTPGHAAFLEMRQRGANVTDIVVLVVAADDSVKPQTLEALRHARAAKVPIIVAITKVDKEGARIDAVKADLAGAGLEIEDFGGDVQVVCVSGKTGEGMEDLEENILTLSEILDHRAELDGQAEGWILESSLKPSGKVATVLVKRGTLRTGDHIAAGLTWAKIRHLRNEAGVEITEAPPGTPVEIFGWKDLPAAGEQVIQAPDEDRAKKAVSYREGLAAREKDATDHTAISESRRALEAQRAREKEDKAEKAGWGAGVHEALPAEENGAKIVNFVVKGDVHGSVEAVTAAVQELGNHEVKPRVLRSATGAITEFDIEHAAVSQSIMLNFGTTTPPHVQRMAEEQNVKILDHTIIYRLVDEVKENMSKYLAPTLSTRVTGDAEVLQIFPINVRGRKYKNIAGCRVRNGVVTNSGLFRILRNGSIIFDGKLETLMQGKKEATEIRKGNECGLDFVDFQDFKVGDQIQAYEEIKTARHL
ncbi:hypothetical protein GGR57DRAFT_471584 [Xylariaceae sp. FL1272]|nr:hypothetical protein GGR57DRAFT_471584 [Xylariaceae sp. FL1272]